MEKIVKRVIPPVVTFLAGYLGGGLIGIPMNWPEAASVTAIAVRGSFILYRLEEMESKN